MAIGKMRAAIMTSLAVLSCGAALFLDAQSSTEIPHDPGVRGVTEGAGQPLSTLTSTQLQFFMDGLSRFEQVDSVTGSISGEPGVGLGPGFNANSCGGCHSQPAPGGSSPNASAYP